MPLTSGPMGGHATVPNQLGLLVRYRDAGNVCSAGAVSPAGTSFAATSPGSTNASVSKRRVALRPPVRPGKATIARHARRWPTPCRDRCARRARRAPAGRRHPRSGLSRAARRRRGPWLALLARRRALPAFRARSRLRRRAARAPGADLGGQSLALRRHHLFPEHPVRRLVPIDGSWRWPSLAAPGNPGLARRCPSPLLDPARVPLPSLHVAATRARRGLRGIRDDATCGSRRPRLRRPSSTEPRRRDATSSTTG